MKNRVSKSLLAMFLSLFSFNFSVSGMDGNINNINNEVGHNERANEAIEPGQIITDEMLGIKSMSLKNTFLSKKRYEIFISSAIKAILLKMAVAG